MLGMSPPLPFNVMPPRAWVELLEAGLALIPG